MTTLDWQDQNEYRKYHSYYFEHYLFDEIRSRFHKQGCLSVEDFFCIVIWKSNRSKSYVAKRLLSSDEGEKGLDKAVEALTRGLFALSNAELKERLRYLWESEPWGFRLPTASAILTVLYPDDFTVYDSQVCDAVGDFHNLYNLTNFDNLWRGYEKYKCKVEESAPSELCLRDKDRYLWGRSFYIGLTEDIRNNFEKGE